MHSNDFSSSRVYPCKSFVERSAPVQKQMLALSESEPRKPFNENRIFFAAGTRGARKGQRMHDAFKGSVHHSCNIQ